MIETYGSWVLMTFNLTAMIFGWQENYGGLGLVAVVW